MYVVLDTETTTLNKGSPIHKDNRLCYAGFRRKSIDYIRCYNDFDYDSICHDLSEIVDAFGEMVVWVGFNLKFDLHWLRNYGINVNDFRIHDCQLAHFILTGQTHPYPSLDEVSSHYNLGSKFDYISSNYWDNGIDTPDIPQGELTEYLKQDLLLTEQVYLKQMEEFDKQPLLYKLFQLQCEDLLTLLEMEYNGLEIDLVGCKEKEEETIKRITAIDKELDSYVGGIPINYNSNDHLSSLLYGGSITHETKVPVGVFKTGKKVGQVRNKVVTYTFNLPRLVEPLKGSELAKEGYWSTDEDTLKSLRVTKEARSIIALLRERSKLEKLRGTYFKGIPEFIKKSGCTDNRVHGSFNQCVARTGRLSSSNPNQQNLAPEMKQLMISRYGNQ